MKTVLAVQKKRAKNAASKKKQSKKVGSKPAKTKPKENLKRLVDSNETEVCVECDKEDPPETQDNSLDSEALWICCDGCNKWCHACCAGVPETDVLQIPGWLCLACSENLDL